METPKVPIKVLYVRAPNDNSEPDKSFADDFYEVKISVNLERDRNYLFAFTLTVSS